MLFYIVLIDDNFHYQDEAERTSHRVFETAEEAVSACKKIVDEWLADALKPGMNSEALWEAYMHFGDDPWVQAAYPNDVSAVNFDAWSYARERAMGRGAVDP